MLIIRGWKEIITLYCHHKAPHCGGNVLVLENFLLFREVSHLTGNEIYWILTKLAILMTQTLRLHSSKVTVYCEKVLIMTRSVFQDLSQIDTFMLPYQDKQCSWQPTEFQKLINTRGRLQKGESLVSQVLMSQMKYAVKYCE